MCRGTVENQMAEILLRVVDRVNTESAVKDRQCTKAGDVIVIKPDGWPWGTKELINPDWRIVKLVGVDPKSIEDFLAEDRNGDILIRPRIRGIDMSRTVVQTAIASGQVITITNTTVIDNFLTRKNKDPVGVIVG
jgi:hypothetical protein